MSVLLNNNIGNRAPDQPTDPMNCTNYNNYSLGGRVLPIDKRTEAHGQRVKHHLLKDDTRRNLFTPGQCAD